MAKLNDKDRELLDAVVQRHAPWINHAIHSLRGGGKIPQSFQDADLYPAGYNAIVEALESFDSSKGSFKNHAHGIIQNRILGHIQKEMSRDQGGVDPYFLNQQRKAKKQQEFEQKTAIPQIKEDKTIAPTQTPNPEKEPK